MKHTVLETLVKLSDVLHSIGGGEIYSENKFRKDELNQQTLNEEVAVILRNCIFNMKKVDGSENKVVVVKTMWNILARLLQEKYF